MEYRRLGRTNLNLSRISYGGLPLFFQSDKVAIEAIHYALDQGVNYFDLDEARNQFITDKVYLDGGAKIGCRDSAIQLRQTCANSQPRQTCYDYNGSKKCCKQAYHPAFHQELVEPVYALEIYSEP